MNLLAHVSSSLTEKILVPDRSKAQDQQNLHYQSIQRCDETMDISYSSPWDSWSNSLESYCVAQDTPGKKVIQTERPIDLIYTTKMS